MNVGESYTGYLPRLKVMFFFLALSRQAALMNVLISVSTGCKYCNQRCSRAGASFGIIIIIRGLLEDNLTDFRN